jgi:hypothetical protein
MSIKKTFLGKKLYEFLEKKNLIIYPVTYCNLFKGITKWFRINPKFFIIGVGRSGTFALYDNLVKNKNGYVTPIKEIHFFDSYFYKGNNWYKAHFPTIFHKFFLENLLKQQIITCDATVSYFHTEVAIKRISQCIPEAKLIVMLRNPVDRAYSHYNIRKKKRNLDSFEEIIKKELKELRKVENFEDDEKILKKYEIYPYLSRGIYVKQLEIWEKYFDKSQILLIKSEDFFNNPLDSLQKIYRFLDMKKYNFKNISADKVNKNSSGFNDEIDSKLRKELEDFFKPYNEELNKNWNINFKWQ